MESPMKSLNSFNAAGELRVGGHTYEIFRLAALEEAGVAKLSRIPEIRIYEVGISYYGRTYQEGKKIGWKDGFRAIYCILKYNLFR